MPKASLWGRDAFGAEKIIGCAFAVSNALGAGFLEKVYQNKICVYPCVSVVKKLRFSLG